MLRFAIVTQRVGDHGHLEVAHVAVDATHHHAVVREDATDDDLIAVHLAQRGLKLGLEERAVSWLFYEVFVGAWCKIGDDLAVLFANVRCVQAVAPDGQPEAAFDANDLWPVFVRNIPLKRFRTVIDRLYRNAHAPCNLSPEQVLTRAAKSE